MEIRGSKKVAMECVGTPSRFTRRNKKGAMEFETLVGIIIIIVVLILVVFGVLVLKGRGDSAIDFIMRIFGK